jgi:ligand-binding sensor domain-containing protein/two-component sensor histidine kinase
MKRNPTSFRPFHGLLLCMLSVLAPLCAVAGTEIIDGHNGLSNSVVYAVAKDGRGLMWIGTRNGLHIYDGYSFSKPFRELANLSVTHLVADNDQQRVWVGTEKGLYVVLTEKGAVRPILDPPRQDSEVSAVLWRPGGGLYAAYRNGEIIYVDSTYQKRHITTLAGDGRNPRFISDIVYDSDSSLIVNVKDGLGICRLFLKDARLEDILVNGEKIIPSWLKGYGDTVMVGGFKMNLRLLDKRNWSDITPALLSGSVGREYDRCDAEKFGNLLYVIHLDNGSGFTKHFSIRLDEQKIDTVYQRNYDSDKGWRVNNCIFRDETGIVWIGSENGLVKVTEDRRLFERILYNETPRATLRAIIRDEQGDMYVGSYRGLFHFSRKEQKWNYYDDLKPPYALINDTSGYVYMAGHLASTNSPLFRFDKKRKVIESDFCDTSLLTVPLTGLALCRDRDGDIWVGTTTGWVVYRVRQQKIIPLQETPFDLGNAVVRQIQQGQDRDILWVATNKGLFQVHRKKGVMFHFHAGHTPHLSNNDIYFVSEDASGRLWLGTNGGGISVISADRKQVQYIDKARNGLANDIVYGILREKNGNLWISTFNGLSCYNPTTGLSINYYTSDGLSHNDFNWGSFWQDPDGKMYFGGVNGINAFYPDSLMLNAGPPPRLFISPVSWWNSDAPPESRIGDLKGDGDRIIVHATSTSLVFNLGLTDYSNPVNNTFSYRVLGLFDHWEPLSGPVLRLNGVPYGSYTVEIRATNPRGVPSVNTLHFDLKVKRLFYKTWWFYMLLLFVVAALVVIFLLIKYRNLKNMQQLRIQIASNLHDEVGSLLTSITLFSDNLRFRGTTGREQEDRLRKIAALSREATVTMSDILWATDVRNDVLHSLSGRMREYAEELLLPVNIELTVDIVEGDTDQKVDAHLRQQLYLIFKEAVNNVIKHAAPTRVHLEFHFQNAHAFLFRLMNDGVPDQAQGIRGQGLKNMKMRAETIGAVMDYQIGNGIFVLTVKRGDHIKM